MSYAAANSYDNGNEPTPFPNHQTPVEGFGIKYSFASPQEFASYHQEGANVEMRNELLLLKRFNSSQSLTPAWIICPLTTSPACQGPSPPWLLVMPLPQPELRDKFPKIGDRCQIKIEHPFSIDGEPVNPGFLTAERIPFKLPRDNACTVYGDLASFKLHMTLFCTSSGDEVKLLEPLALARNVESLSGITMGLHTAVGIKLRLDVNLVSYKAEMSALEHLMSAPEEDSHNEKSRKLFKWILDFNLPAPYFVNLFDHLPHMKDPSSTALPGHLVQLFKGLNRDHLQAYQALSNIPASIHMVVGCPGAGKTHFNLLIAAIAQARQVTIQREGCGPRMRYAKVLYLLDMNQPVDDVAERMARLYRSAGLPHKVVRMHGWPSEMRQSKVLNDSQGQNKAQECAFMKNFLSIASHLRSEESHQSSSSMAPSLDEAAWDHFQRHKDRRYKRLAALLEKLFSNGIQSENDQKTLRNAIYNLYKNVLGEVNFVATTPVAAFGNFNKFFEPDLVFLDEAPHARELTGLIPIAFFSPLAWIFTGDFKQTRPYVAGANSVATQQNDLEHNPFAPQLLVSMMERAEKTGVLKNYLMINHRAHGNLQRLPSDLFYEGRMVSGLSGEHQLLGASGFFRFFLEKLHPSCSFPEPRLLVHLKLGREVKRQGSFFNPSHENWVLARVSELMSSPDFRQLEQSEKAGSVLIMAPYRAAVTSYKARVQDLERSWQDRIDVRTIDSAQGHQADCVFLDLVRTDSPGFMDDANRLNVALTRARQAEIILMHPGMTMTRCDNFAKPTEILSRLWADCLRQGNLTSI